MFYRSTLRSARTATRLARKKAPRASTAIYATSIARQYASASADKQPDLSAAGLFKSDSQLASVDKKWAQTASDDRIEKAKKGLEKKKFGVTVVGTKAEALKKVLEMIPSGVSVHNAGSTSLIEIGFVDHAKKETKWNNLHAKILAEKNPEKQSKLRQEAILADYFLSSASAVTENGEIVACDFTGTRVGAFHQGASHLVLVVGSQKIVRNLDEAYKRQSEYCLPLESARVRVAFKVPNSEINNIAVLSGANPWGTPGRVHVILVKESLGF